MMDFELPSTLLISFVILIIVQSYLALAIFIFAIRHPWLTRTQLYLHVAQAIMFKKYSQDHKIEGSMAPVIFLALIYTALIFTVLYEFIKAYAVIFK